ncbi:Hypothetical predicted protein [Mytilus galloprovincialis]|uniref:ATP-dependent DNA helicase n=1 Tax=Mytilus galloprovincialis TaxID=29158 RepID=A0A8B6GX66_MYTGA|nr:Hypothetical predicted protein [Mytilus galloprovincialis]
MTTDELKQTFASDEQFHDARQRILSTETLIIDEVGMLSQLMFEKVELVCRILKNPHLYFGGLQVVRQNEQKLVEAVNQLCNGSPSAETEEFLKSLDRPLPNVNEHGKLLILCVLNIFGVQKRNTC